MILNKKEMKMQYAPLFDPKELKEKFLRGQPYNITHYVESKHPKISAYQETMQGKHHEDKAKIVDYERTSCGIGGVIPDP
jgi:hypothetical protein